MKRADKVAYYIYKYHREHGIESTREHDYYLALAFIDTWGEHIVSARRWYRRRHKYWSEKPMVYVWLEIKIYSNEGKIPPISLWDRIVHKIKEILGRWLR